MEFFRKYQRLILYSAGIFALVTFSATGSILGFIDSVFQTRAPLPVMEIRGREVEVQPIDNEFAARIVRWESSAQDPTLVLPNVLDGRGDDSRVEVYAALRRIALEYGIEVSDQEVDKAIEQGVQIMAQVDTQVTDPTALALRLGFASLPAYREVVREAMRIGSLVRLESLAVDTSDAALVQKLVADMEKIVVKAAVVDAEAMQEAMEADEDALSDDDLVAWLEDLETFEKSAFVDPDRYRVQAAYLLLGDDFDPESFAAELEDSEFSDEEVEQFYTRQRFRLYQKPKADKAEDGEEKDGEPEDGEQNDGEQNDDAQNDGESEDPVEEKQDPEVPEYLELDDALKARIRSRLQAERIVNKLWETVRERLESFVEAERDALSAAEGPVAEAAIAVDEARILAEAEDADDAAKAVLEAAEAALESAEAAKTAAEEALVAKRADFPLEAVWTELAAGRPGLGVVSSGEEPKLSQDLKDIDVVGPWEASSSVVALSDERPLSTQIQHTPPAVFQLRLQERIESPLKPLDDIREDARTRYFSEQADERAEEIAKAFKETLEELAKAKIADEIADLEGKRDTDLEEKLAEWRTTVQERLDSARERLAELKQSRGDAARVTVAAQQRVDDLAAQLAAEEARREEILAELQAELDETVEEKTREQFAGVFDEAVAAHEGVKLEVVGPLPRDLSSGGYGAHRESYPKAVRYLFFGGRVTDLDEGDVVEMEQDFAERAWVGGIVTGVEPGSLADVTRRQVLSLRQQQASQRRLTGVRQSYSLEALTERFGWRRPTEVVTPVDGEE